VSAAFVRADGLVKRYRGRHVLAGVDLFAQGGVISVLGPNGAGKTTLLRCLATVVAHDAGTVSIDGLDPGREPERIEIRRRLGYLPQDVGVVEGATAFDTVDYLAVLKGERDDRRRRRAVFDVLDRVGLRDRAGDRVERLSGGMRRRLGLAQALLGAPSLLLLDEPGAGLDPDERLRLREILTERRSTATVVVSTHLTDEAAISDTVIVLDDGLIRFSGTPERLAAVAAGRTWVQPGLPPPDVRASWRLADGRTRCLGTPPPGADLVAPTLEDGYLLVRQ
jgi:ABC-2 type transport system ATP-binding protein